MYTKIFLVVILALIYISCGNRQKTEKHSHGHEHLEETVHSEHDHEAETNDEHETAHENVHQHDEDMHQDEHDVQEHAAAESVEHMIDEVVKIKLTAYSKNFEVFAEADPFFAGGKSSILAHFSSLPDFNPLKDGKINARLIVHGHESSQTREQPHRPGIYRFELVPEHDGVAEIIFEISQNDSLFLIHLKDITVYPDKHDAIHEAEEDDIVAINTVVFTKEQSWKIDFATEKVQVEPFGEIIKTSALVQSAPGDEVQVTAKTNGIVHFSTNTLVDGLSISNGQNLINISGSGLANDNSEVRYAEAKNNYENAKANYDRTLKLAEDKIVSQKDLLAAKNEFKNTHVVFENLKTNFNAAGQSVTSPINGFIKQLFVQNGEYVIAGQPLVTISQNKNLILHAEVQQKYLPVLGAIQSANIRTLHNNKTYTLNELSGKIISYGRMATAHNYLLPVTLQIDNKGSFIPGGFVELFLQITTNAQAVTVPNSALLEEQGNYFVMVQVTPELFEKREIKTGASDGLRTEIIEGLASEERVVTKGAVIIKLAQSTGTLDAHSGHVH